MKPVEIAEKLGVKANYIYKLGTGDRAPDRDLAFKIETLTEGKITARSWSKTTS